MVTKRIFVSQNLLIHISLFHFSKMEDENFFKSSKRFKSMDNISILSALRGNKKSFSNPTQKYKIAKTSEFVQQDMMFESFLNEPEIPPTASFNNYESSSTSGMKCSSAFDLSAWEEPSTNTSQPISASNMTSVGKNIFPKSGIRVTNMSFEKNDQDLCTSDPVPIKHDFRSPQELASSSCKLTDDGFEMFALPVIKNISFIDNRFDISIKKKKEICIQVKQLIEEFFQTLDIPICELNFYAGITVRFTFEERLGEHRAIHEHVDGQILSRFSTFSELCHAESEAIAYLRTLTNQGVIKDCWNKTNGFDVGTINAQEKALQSNTMILYIIWSKNIDIHDSTVGSLGRKRHEQKRVDGKAWSLASSTPVALKASTIEKHIECLDRMNLRCELCNKVFSINSALILHNLKTHEKPKETLFKCKLCELKGDAAIIREHIKVKIKTSK